MKVAEEQSIKGCDTRSPRLCHSSSEPQITGGASGARGRVSRYCRGLLWAPSAGAVRNRVSESGYLRFDSVSPFLCYYLQKRTASFSRTHFSSATRYKLHEDHDTELIDYDGVRDWPGRQITVTVVFDLARQRKRTPWPAACCAPAALCLSCSAACTSVSTSLSLGSISLEVFLPWFG